ncbi:hypothetical protein BBG19_1528 [Francisella sp. MA067296]|nr:hypothetical protein BBG19_1528 [Francisella sp. MA067296]
MRRISAIMSLNDKLLKNNSDSERVNKRFAKFTKPDYL